MSITIELEADAEEAIRGQAAARGVPVEDYVTSLVRQAANGALTVRPSREEFAADMVVLAEGLDHIPPPPPDAYSREAIYCDHD